MPEAGSQYATSTAACRRQRPETTPSADGLRSSEISAFRRSISASGIRAIRVLLDLSRQAKNSLDDLVTD
jgi:hypothetical protein